MKHVGFLKCNSAENFWMCLSSALEMGAGKYSQIPVIHRCCPNPQSKHLVKVIFTDVYKITVTQE